jgi:hypothetical protein
MKKNILYLLLILANTCFATEAAPETTKQEISYLFSYLENSGCQFNRNGTWYQPKDAVAHLNKKYQYLLGKHLVPSTEAFIERAATESSISGKPYLVQCHGSAPTESATWFKSSLTKYRQSPQ